MEIMNQNELESDISALSHHLFRKHDLDEDSVKRSIRCIISLYCKRQNLPYLPFMSDVLVPLLVCSCSLSPPIASSCFYSLCNSFLPVYGYYSNSTILSCSAFELRRNELIKDKLSAWLRLLVAYHFPTLALHLDSVHPNWERLVHRENRTGNYTDGMIPISWVCGVFAGCILSPDALLVLWDWCIVHDQPMGGLYLSASLLGAHEETLLTLTSPQQLHEWVTSMCSGGSVRLKTSPLFPCEHSGGTEDKPFGALENNLDDSIEYDDDDEFNMTGRNLGMGRGLANRGNTGLNLVSLGQSLKTSSSGVTAASPEASQNTKASVGFYDIPCEYDDNEEPIEANPEVAMKNSNTTVESDENSTCEEKLINCGHSTAGDSSIVEKAFLCGWVKCTSVLMRNTPITFQKAVKTVPDWAAARARSELVVCDTFEQLGDDEQELDKSNHNWGRLSRSNSVGSDSDLSADMQQCGVFREESDTSLYSESMKPHDPTGSPDKTNTDSALHMTDINSGIAAYGKALWTKGYDMMSLKSAGISNQIDEGNDNTPTTTLSSTSSRYTYHTPTYRACMFTSANEVLPCVCSTRRRDNISSRMLFQEAFRNAAMSVLSGDGGTNDSSSPSLPSPSTDNLHVSEKPFFFAVDCWPEDDNAVGRRPFRIPKAFTMPYTAVVDATAMSNMLSVLEPLSNMVHIVLIGKGHEFIRQHENRKLAQLSPKSKPKVLDEGLLSIATAEEDAQIGAMAMSLIKHGFSHVSILEGGYGSVLRYLRYCDGLGGLDTDGSECTPSSSIDTPSKNPKRGDHENESLGLHVLVDVDQDEVDCLFSPHKASSPHKGRWASHIQLE
eukprot:CAMPEP_0185029328 /NCGR_PEP_ID=MMETSP1103-20130426/15560_1 /TAXON_ID=36769 /ORGANISM="Paraphysomonas bandaiensis, Strain Caron Lab Isolate" /LENGTH=837 /DNA_ID=CAMNT_0027564019 /DNA_START=268 /DNA_END=2782 /DNA_ORIENTATION=+